MTACTDKYQEYLGTYECISITSDNQDILHRYEYYTLELKRNRNMIADFKLSVSPYTSATTKSKFDIDGEKFIETVDKIKNEYKIIDGVIILEMTVSNIHIVAKFQRAESQQEN